MIYAIQSGDAGPIKFGVADNPESRLGELQTGNPQPLRLLAACAVHRRNEALVHRHLIVDHIRGEWFAPTERVMALVEVIKRQAVSEEHVLINHIYEKDFPAIVWHRRRHLALAVFPHEVERARACGLDQSLEKNKKISCGK